MRKPNIIDSFLLIRDAELILCCNIFETAENCDLMKHATNAKRRIALIFIYNNLIFPLFIHIPTTNGAGSIMCCL